MSGLRNFYKMTYLEGKYSQPTLLEQEFHGYQKLKKHAATLSSPFPG